MSETSYHQSPESVAGAPVGCPVHGSFSPLEHRYVEDPYPIANGIRAETPVVYVDELGHVMVSSMELVNEVFLDPETYASSNVQDPVFPLAEDAGAVLAAPDFDPVAVMSNRQPPDHGRIRNYTKRLFTNKRVKTLEPYIRRRSAELIDEMRDAGPPADFVASLAFGLPGEVIFRFIGFPESDDAMLKAWCADRLAFSWGQPRAEDQQEIAEKLLAYWRYVREFVAEKAASPGEDLASELLGYHALDNEELSYREVESIVYGLSFAGHEPVTLLLGNALQSLLPRRDLWSALVEDPSGIPKAMDEVIRHNSPQIGWRRVTTRPTTLGGVELPEGTPIYLNLGAANRDPQAFSDPDVLDTTRRDAARNISFGKGIHYCLGAKFARFEGNVVMDEIVRRLPSLELAGAAEYAYPNITFRGPRRLDVTW